MEEGNKSSYVHEHKAPAVEEAGAAGEVEVKDRGLFDHFGKKDEEKRQEEVIVTQFDEKVHVSEAPHEHKKEEKEEEHEKKQSLLEKLHRSGSGSSSSSDEEEGEEGEKKKKKKEKKKKDHEVTDHHDTTVPVEKYEDASPKPEEKKGGFIEKIKEKLPGAKKTPGEDQHDHQEHIPPPPPPVVEHAPHTEEHVSSTETTHDQGGEGKEKKGLLEKIKEKLPGYHAKSTSDQDDKEKEKESASY